MRAIIAPMILLGAATACDSTDAPDHPAYRSDGPAIVTFRVTASATGSSRSTEVGSAIEDFVDLGSGDYRLYLFTADDADGGTFVSRVKPTEAIADAAEGGNGATPSYTVTAEIAHAEGQLLRGRFRLVMMANLGTYPPDAALTSGVTTLRELTEMAEFNAPATPADGGEWLSAEEGRQQLMPFYGVRVFTLTDEPPTSDATGVTVAAPSGGLGVYYTIKDRRGAPRLCFEDEANPGGLTSVLPTSPEASEYGAQWCFLRRFDRTFDIVNRATGNYVNHTSSNNTQLTTSATRPERGWSVRTLSGYSIIVNVNCQFNTTTATYSYKVYNWGSGNNTTDSGCQYIFAEVDRTVNDLSGEPLQLLRGLARVEVTVNDPSNPSAALESVSMTNYSSRGFCAPDGLFTHTDLAVGTAAAHTPADAIDPDADPLQFTRIVEHASDGSDRTRWLAYVAEHSTADGPATLHITVPGIDGEATVILADPDGTPCDIMRNTVYRVTITDINTDMNSLTVTITAKSFDGSDSEWTHTVIPEITL